MRTKLIKMLVGLISISCLFILSGCTSHYINSEPELKLTCDNPVPAPTYSELMRDPKVHGYQCYLFENALTFDLHRLDNNTILAGVVWGIESGDFGLVYVFSVTEQCLVDRAFVNKDNGHQYATIYVIMSPELFEYISRDGQQQITPLGICVDYNISDILPSDYGNIG